MSRQRREDYGMEAKAKHPEARLAGTLSNDVSSPVYWDMRYQRQRERDGPDYTFEWYCKLETVEVHMRTVFADYDAPRILVLGCGNSKLSEVMYNNGHADVTNVDFSAVVISDMKKRYKTYEGMLWFVCNAMDLSLFPENSFDIIIDKGCMDCLFGKLDGARSAIKACKEVFRVLAPRGHFLMYSCASPGARKTHLSAKDLNWSVQGIFIDGTAASYYYIMKTNKKYATSAELAKRRAAKEAERKAAQERRRARRRSSALSTSSLARPSTGMTTSSRISANLKRLSLSKAIAGRK